MDSVKVVFLLTLYSFLEGHAKISRQRYRRAMGKNKAPTIFNKNIYNIPSILKDIRDNPNRRSFVSAEDPEPNIYVLRKSSYDQVHPKNDYKMHRRMYDFHAGMRSPIISAPSSPNHLPEAEPILPGHTLLRPALGMLKSQVKFPHKDMDDASGVYGNMNNLGITYGGTGERVLYTGFRRNNNNFNDEIIQDKKPKFLVAVLRTNTDYEDKPIARFIDYYKLEQEKKKRREDEMRMIEEEKHRLSMPPADPYNIYINDNRIRDVKRLLKSLTANGITLEFFEIPRLKVEAMKDENYHESIKPYTEFLEATRVKELTWVEKRFPKIARQYARDQPQKYRTLATSRQGRPSGIKKYNRR